MQGEIEQTKRGHTGKGTHREGEALQHRQRAQDEGVVGGHPAFRGSNGSIGCC